MSEPLLVVNNLDVVYHRVATAVQGVSLEVAQRSIVALIGTNGAGKTTTLRAIAGFMRADDVQITRGEIVFRGTSIGGLRSDQVTGLGVALVPERDKIFSTMTVRENLAVCRRSGGGKGQITEEQLLRLFPALERRYSAVAGYLSGGERQMLAISMALLGEPKLLLIDEMTLGLAPVVVADLLRVLRSIRDEYAVSLLVVDQNGATAVEIADTIYVMENGRIVFGGTPAALLDNEDFREFYLGMDKEGMAKSYRDVKQYQRKRRWFG